MSHKLVRQKMISPADVDIPLLIQMTYAFAESAQMLERVVETPPTGYDPEWFSIKLVSHYNLGTALELLLKLILVRANIDPPYTHTLMELYRLIPRTATPALQDMFLKCAGTMELKLVAFVKAPSTPTHLPPNRPIDTIKDLLDYFDKDLKLSEKRYVWAVFEKQEWVHLIENPSVFVTWIHTTLDFLKMHKPT